MQSNTFKFVPIYEKKPIIGVIIMNVEEIINEEGNKCYEIKYDNIFPEKLNKYQVNKAHPFHKNNELIEHMYGEIIIKNVMTENMVKLLLMLFDELGEYSGSCDSLYYKGVIMKSITNFWIQ
jgi:hypothetical protein